MADTHSSTGRAMDLESRKEELFATITLLNAASRQIYEMQAAGAPPADLAPLFERQAQLTSDKERLSHEVNSEYMYRNLSSFMGRLEDYDRNRASEATQIIAGQERTLNEIGGLGAAMAALQRQFSDLGEVVSDHGMQLSEHAKRLADVERRLDANDARLDRLEGEIAQIRISIATDRGAIQRLRRG